MEDLRCCGNCTFRDYVKKKKKPVCVCEKTGNEIDGWESCDSWDFDDFTFEKRSGKSEY